MRTVKTVIGSSALVMLMVASPAMAQSRNSMLKGDFAFSATTVCINNPGVTVSGTYELPGFNADLTPKRTSAGMYNANVNWQSFQGVRTFNGDGTGTVTGRSVSMGLGGASASDIDSEFTYSVSADGIVKIDATLSDSVVVAGPGVGNKGRLRNVPTLVGRLSLDRKSLTYGTYDPGVETNTRLFPPPVQMTNERVCHRATKAIRISE